MNSEHTPTGADREAAQALCASVWTGAIEAFAAHRIASTRATEAEAKRLREELDEALGALRDCHGTLTDEVVGTIYQDDPDWYARVDAAAASADTILTRHNGGKQ